MPHRCVHGPQSGLCLRKGLPGVWPSVLASSRALIRLETTRRLQKVTYTEQGEREYGSATDSRGLIDPKRRKKRRVIVFLVVGFRDSLSALLAVFLSVRPSVRLFVRHSGTALRPFRVLQKYHNEITLCAILHTPHPAENNLAQLSLAFGSDPRSRGSVPADDIFFIFC